MRALSGESSEPQDILIRWIFENDINPHTVFAERWAADAMSTFQGIDSVMYSINHALTDDGDISFVLCEGTAPSIIFLDHREPAFRENFLGAIRGQGHGNYVMPIFEPAGTVPDVRSYIATHEAYEVKRQAAYDQFMGPDPD